METQPTTFTRKTRTRQIILGVLVTALIVALVVAVIVLAILLDRKKINDRDGGDEGEQVQNGSRRENTCLRWFANNQGADQPAHPRRQFFSRRGPNRILSNDLYYEEFLHPHIHNKIRTDFFVLKGITGTSA